MPLLPYSTPYVQYAGVYFNFQNAFNTETVIAGIATGANLSSLSTIDGQQWSAISTLSSISYYNTLGTSSLSSTVSYNTLATSSLSTTMSYNTLGISSLSTITSLNTQAISSLSTIATFRPSFSIYVAPNGNDITGTGAELIPFSTINRAIGHRSSITSAAEVGIVIAPGTYSNSSIVVSQNTFLIGAPAGEFSQAVNINGQIALQANGGQAGLYGLNLFPAVSQCVIVNNAGTYNINACNFVNTGNHCFYQSLGTVYLTECRFTCPTTGTFTGIGSAGLSNPTLIMRDCVLTTSGHPTLVEYSGNLTMRQCTLTNTSALSTVSSLVVYNPVNNNNSCEISYCTLQYTSGTSALNKICIRAGTPGATISTSLVNCVYNLLLCEGAQSGMGQHCIDKAAGSGAVSLSYGNLLGGAVAHRIDGTISKTQYNSVP